MPRGPHPFLLILSLALPVSAGALGLGDIHVDSVLNEPLSAQIDIVGASLDDLTDLRAAVASLETFQRYGADRPAFLNSATFKIGRDAQGRPVLNVRSHDSFTDPLVSFLVDLKWRNSELVREYSLLLDPAGLSVSRRAAAAKTTVATAPDSNTPALIAAPAPGIIAATPAIIAPTTSIITPASIGAPAHAVGSGSHHRISSRDTLRAIVRHAGARSETEVQRMMIATFRANPAAFDGNINRLHRGIVLDIPSSADVAGVSASDAKQTVDAQMLAWRTPGHYGIAHRAPAAAPEQVPSAHDAARDQNNATLTDRLQSLEQQLGDLHRQVATDYANIQELRRAASRGASPDTRLASREQPAQATALNDRAALAESVSPTLDAASSPKARNTLLGSAALLLGMVLAGYAYFRRRLQRPVPQHEARPVEALPEDAVSSRTVADPIAAVTVPEAVRTAPAPLRSSVPSIAAAWPPASRDAPATGMAIEVDTEALERSYLESLGFNTSALGEAAKNAASTAATAELEMSEVEDPELEDPEIDATEVNTAVIKVDATTLVVAVTADASATGATTAAVAPVIDTGASATTELDFNLANLDATAEHVQMPSALNDHVEVSEGRTNIVDVLKMAIDRDPHRRDLRMKLVETYYNAAAGNRRAFMEVVRKLAREREYMSAEEWGKVARMGQEIASDDILFADLVKSKDDVAA